MSTINVWITINYISKFTKHLFTDTSKTPQCIIIFAVFLIIFFGVLFLGYGHVWLGLIDVSREGRYVYSSTGVKPRYLNWHRTEPAGGKGENCAVLVTTQRVWHDYPCTSKMSYVCKKPEKRMDLNSNYCKWINC